MICVINVKTLKTSNLFNLVIGNVDFEQTFWLGLWVVRLDKLFVLGLSFVCLGRGFTFS